MNKTYWKCNSDVCDLIGVKEILADLSNFYIGENVSIIVDGKEMTRKVYDDRDCGMSIKVKGYQVSYDDFQERA